MFYCLIIKSLIDKLISWLFLEFKDQTNKCNLAKRTEKEKGLGWYKPEFKRRQSSRKMLNHKHKGSKIQIVGDSVDQMAHVLQQINYLNRKGQYIYKLKDLSQFFKWVGLNY